MKSNYKKLGQYIQPINIRNKDLEVETLLGVSVKKIFIPSIANTVGTDFKKYKIVKKHQFVYIPDTSRRGDKIGIAMLEDYEKALVSQAYSVFKIIDEKSLSPEYLMMWFRRTEFDRYARYKSHGSVREIFDWEELCDTELPIPSIEKQNKIVKEYNTVENRIKLNEQLNQKLEETAQALYKHWFVDFESASEKLIGDILTPQKGRNITRSQAINGDYPVIAGGIEPSCYHNDFNTNKPVVTISASGANAGYVNLFLKNVWAADCSYIDVSSYKNIFFVYCCLKVNEKLLMSKQIGTGQPHIYPEQISIIPINNYTENRAEEFNNTVKILFEKIDNNLKLNTLLNSTRNLLLSKMTRLKT